MQTTLYKIGQTNNNISTQQQIATKTTIIIKLLLPNNLDCTKIRKSKKKKNKIIELKASQQITEIKVCLDDTLHCNKNGP